MKALPRCRWLFRLGAGNRRLPIRQRRLSAERLDPRILLAAGTGLQGQYFHRDDLTDLALVRLDAHVAFDWAESAPDPAIAADHFSGRWSGQLEADRSEPHRFFLNSEGGARLWVNGQLLIDEFAASRVVDAEAQLDLVAGRRYDLLLEYRESSGPAGVRLEWSSPILPLEVIPTGSLFPAARGSIAVERFDSIQGAAVSALTGDADFPTHPDAVAALERFEVPPSSGDAFGQRIRGLLHAPQTGAYTFYLAADDSAELWLSNSADEGQKRKIAEVTEAVGERQWSVSASQRSAAVSLVAGQSYYVEALHKEATGADHLGVGWTLPGSAEIQVISGEHLSPVLPTVRAYAVLPSAAEGTSSPARFEIVRRGTPLNNPLTVHYALRGEAVNGMDYAPLDGSIEIPAGQVSVPLNVLPLADADVEGPESVVIELQADSTYAVGLKSERTVYGTIQDDAPPLAGGSSLWNGTSLADFNTFGGLFSTESVPGLGDVLQAAITTQPANPYNAQLKQNIDQPVLAGDIVWVAFRARSLGTAGKVTAVFERASTPFTKSLSQGLTIGTDWARVQIPFPAGESYLAGEASFGFHLGHQVQTLQFADFQLLDYGPPRSLADQEDLRLNSINGSWGTAQTVPVSGQPFATAYQVQTTVVPTQVWHLQAMARNSGVVALGDTIRIAFSLRSIAGAAPRTRLLLQRTDNYNTLFGQTIDPTPAWQSFTFDIVSPGSFTSAGLQFVWNLGYGLQTIEIGGLTWKNLDYPVDLEDLPRQVPPVTYAGRGGTDAWREAADARIADHRLGTLTVQVNDLADRPLDGAEVFIRQRRHAFLFGSAINAYDGKLDPDANARDRKYQSEIVRLFNTVVLENSLKWPGFLQDRQRGIDGANFAVENGLVLRGHNVIWPSRSNMPSSIWSEYDALVASSGRPVADPWLRGAIEARIDDVVSTFRGIVPEWDVVNEPFTNHDVMDILGDAILLDWFQRMRDADPSLRLTLNDYGIFANNGSNVAHRVDFESWLGQLKNAGLLDVIGEQSHYSDASLTDIPILAQLIEAYFTQFDTPIAITEFDVNSTDEQLQADYLRDYLTMAFSQPAVAEFLHWGFWEDSHWLPDAALYRSDFSIKPNGQVYEDLVFGNWWSDLRGTTRGGEVAADVFLGDYEILVQHGGRTYAASAAVDDAGGSRVTVRVPAAPVVLGHTVLPGAIELLFSHDLDVSTLNLYDAAAGVLGEADITLRGQAVGPVPGSLIVTGDRAVFVPTGGPLAPDHYTLTVRSGSDGVRAAVLLSPLDGNADGTAGDDCVLAFAIEPSAEVVVRLPDFARGPGQAVGVPAPQIGLPVSLARAAGVQTIELTITYDPVLLSITGGVPGSDAPNDATVTVEPDSPGTAKVTFSSPLPLSVGTAEIVRLEAAVPPDAPYGAAHVLAIASVHVNGGGVSATGDSAIHAVANLGDATGNRAYSGLDAQRVARVSVALDQGFLAYPRIDPVVLADVTGNGRVSGLDAQRIAQFVAGLHPAEIPPLPGPGGPEWVSAAATSGASPDDSALPPFAGAWPEGDERAKLLSVLTLGSIEGDQLMTWRTFLALACAAVAGCQNASAPPSSPGGTAASTAEDEGASQQVSLRVPTMHCPMACWPKVKETLEKQDGVAEVKLVAQQEADAIDNPVVTLSLDGNFDSVQAIAALTEAGFAEAKLEP